MMNEIRWRPMSQESTRKAILRHYSKQKDLLNEKNEYNLRNINMKMLEMNRNGIRKNIKNKYECDQRQYFFRGQKKFDHNIQKMCFDIIKKPEIEPIKKMDQNQIQIEKLLIKCRDLEENEFRSLIEKYQNKDEFYQLYFQKDSEGDRGFVEQMQEQLGQIKKTIQNTNLSEQIKTINVHVKNNYIEENKSIYHQSLNTNQNNNVITNFQKQQSEQESAQMQTQQGFFPTQMNVGLLRNPSDNVLNFQVKKDMQRTNAQIRLYSATYNRQLRKKQQEIMSQKNKNSYWHSKSTRREMGSVAQIPPVLNDVAQKAERIFSAQNNMRSKACLAGMRVSGSAASQYRKYHCKTHLE